MAVGLLLRHVVLRTNLRFVVTLSFHLASEHDYLPWVTPQVSWSVLSLDHNWPSETTAASLKGSKERVIIEWIG
jgi:hypothetical protein